MSSDENLGTRHGSRKAQTGKPNAPLATVAFNPTSLITGAGGFWRADAGVTLSGSNVTQWNDQSSFANNLTNNGTASNVTFSSTGFNASFSAVSFVDNSNGTMRVSGAFAASTTATMFFLISPNISTGSSRLGWLFTTAAGTDFTTPSFTCYSPSVPSFTCYSSGNQGNSSNPISLSNGTPVLVGIVFDSVHANLWQNGSVVGSATSFSSNLGAASGITFGLGNDVDLNASNAPAAGDHIAFCGLTQKAMNSTDWTNLKNWSNAHWGTSF